MLAESLAVLEYPAPPPEEQAFYERDPKASRIRTHCLEVVNAWDLLLHDRTIEQSALRQNSLVKRNILIGEWLQQNGITPEMHQQEARRGFTDDPVTRAEYIAGQILPYIDLEPKPDPVALFLFLQLHRLVTANSVSADEIKEIQTYTEVVELYRTLHNLMGMCYEAFDSRPKWGNVTEDAAAEEVHALMQEAQKPAFVPPRLWRHIESRMVTRFPCIVEFLELESLTRQQSGN
jgi:hypothetical protein